MLSRRIALVLTPPVKEFAETSSFPISPGHYTQHFTHPSLDAPLHRASHPPFPRRAKTRPFPGGPEPEAGSSPVGRIPFPLAPSLHPPGPGAAKTTPFPMDTHPAQALPRQRLFPWPGVCRDKLFFPLHARSEPDEGPPGRSCLLRQAQHERELGWKIDCLLQADVVS